MSDVIKEYFESTFETSEGITDANISNDALPIEGPENTQYDVSETSTYTLANDQSLISRDVDLGLRGTTTNTGIQLSRIPLTQRSTSANITNMNSNGMWYVLALLLPFLSITNYSQWTCSPSTIINAAEIIICKIGRACDNVRGNIRRLTQNPLSRELVATAMDALLVVYAIGFLVLSMYQASIIG